MISIIVVSSAGIATIAYAVWATISDDIRKAMVERWVESYPAVPYVRDKRVIKEVAKMKKLIMIDLETMAVTKDAAIIQLGAAVFRFTTPEYQGDLRDLIGNNTFCINIQLQSCLDAGLVTDRSTTAWWNMSQQIEAFRTTQANAVPLRDALMLFRTWCLADTDPGDIETWANGTSFDLAILETAYRKVGVPTPWRFFNERDYRTMKNLYRDVPKPSFEGTKHNAMDDALNQAVHLLAIMQHIDRMEMAARPKVTAKVDPNNLESADYAI